MSHTPQEVADLIKVSKPIVLAAIRRGELKAWKPSQNLYRIEPEDLVEWKMSRMSNTKPKRTTATRLRALEGGR